MITISEAYASARGAIFRMPIEPGSEGQWWWGTGFFISSTGYALTAFHNLSANVAAARRGQVQGLDPAGNPFLLDFIPMAGDKERDVALLRLCEEKRPTFQHLPLAALPDGLSNDERVRFWAGRPAVISGFPVSEQGQEEESIAGHMRGDGPLGIEDEKDGDRLAAQAEKLRIVPDRSTDLPGISGGPVIDLETGFVVAVEGSCDWSRNLIFASELMPNLPSWPDEVRPILQRLENTPAVLRDHANALITIPRRPWDPARLPPGALLRADCAAAVPFHGRLAERTSVEAWCAAEAPLGIRLYTASGGMGKTRLFLHICECLKTSGWRAGFLRAEAAGASEELWLALIRQPQPLLLIVDYAETRRRELVSLLRAASQAASTRVRIILLARAAGDWWEAMKREGHGVGDLLSGPATRWHTLQPLAISPKAREDSYWTAAKTFAHALGKPLPATAPEDLNAEHFDRVLLLHISALAAIDGVQVNGEQGILDYMLGRERRFWSKQVEAGGLSHLLEHGIAQAMAVVTLGGGATDPRHASRILRKIPLLQDQPEIVRRAIATLLHEAYPGGQWIEPMLPDLLGEHLVQVELGKDDGTLLDLVFGSPDARSERRSS
jgi:Trypsin-like peptidase domain